MNVDTLPSCFINYCFSIGPINLVNTVFIQRFLDVFLNKNAFYVFTERRKASFASPVYATANLSVSVSVCASVTLRHCVKTREHKGMRFSPLGIPVPLAFWCQEWLMGDNPLQVKFECKEVDPVKRVELYTYHLKTPEP